jgi:putative modified peptide
MRVEADITKEQAVELANKLAHDDDFRARLQSDPQAVLAEFHISIPKSAVPSQVSLPPKEKLQAAIGQVPGGRLTPQATNAHWAFLVFIAFL